MKERHRRSPGPAALLAAVLLVPLQAALAAGVQYDTEEVIEASAALADVPLSADARRVARWAVDHHDADGKPFVMVDKTAARAYVFEADGRLRSASPVLLGIARGDDSVPGIGQRPIKLIRPHERTTPAGRFAAEAGHNSAGEDIVWIDYDAAVSMHRVRATNPRERRLQRLASPTVADNRISYGCINVPPAFFNEEIKPLFEHGRRTTVYVLPETRSALRQFRIDEPSRGGAEGRQLASSAR